MRNTGRTRGDGSGRLPTSEFALLSSLRSAHPEWVPEVVAIYTRVSHEDLEEPASTRRQERSCRRFAESKDWQVVGIWEDVDLSAYQRGVRRPAFERLMTVVAGGRVNGVVVWKLD